MYRLLVLCAILTFTFAEPTWHRNHKHSCLYHGRTDHATIPEQPNPEIVLQNVIDQDEKLQKLCTNETTTSSRPREMYGPDSYFLTYTLPSEDLKVTVQITHKFIHTVCKKHSSDSKNVLEDVIILPDMVKTDDAVYTIQNKNLLKITIPYKVALGQEVVKDCGVVNNKVIDVPEVLHPLILYRNKDNNEVSPTVY